MDPSQKYRDKVSPDHKAAMDAVVFASQLVEPYSDEIDKFLKAESEAHSFGHIVDPTLYLDMINSKNFALQVRMAKAAQAFIREMASVKADAAKSI